MGIKDVDFTPKFDRFLSEAKEEFFSKLNSFIREFLNEGNLTWADFKKHGQTRQAGRTIPGEEALTTIEILYRDEVIIECERKLELATHAIKVRYDFTLFFKQDSANVAYEG